MTVEWNDNQPIYRQLRDMVVERIMDGSFAEGEAVPSVRQVAADYQGRLFTLLASIAGAITPVALLIAAPIAELLGIRFWYVAGGAACVLIAVVAATIPAVMQIDANRDLSEEAEAPATQQG